VPFDSDAWKAAQGSEDSLSAETRFNTPDDLVASGRLLGMSRVDVLALLRVSPGTSYFSEYDRVYFPGPERGWMSIDSESLLVRFDDNDVTLEAVIKSD